MYFLERKPPLLEGSEVPKLESGAGLYPRSWRARQEQEAGGAGAEVDTPPPSPHGRGPCPSLAANSCFIQIGPLAKTLTCGRRLVWVHIYFHFFFLLFLGWNLFLR